MTTSKSKMPFNFLNKRKRMTKSFNKDEIHFIRAGQKINIYDLIQKSGQDTDLYEIMDKYGVNSQEAIARATMNTGQMYQDMNAINSPKDLRDALEKSKLADNMWKQLPLSVRSEFNNSKAEFMNRGEKWLKNKMIEEQKMNRTYVEPNKNTTSTEQTQEVK